MAKTFCETDPLTGRVYCYTIETSDPVTYRERALAVRGGRRALGAGGGAYTCTGGLCVYGDCEAFERFALLQTNLNEVAPSLRLLTVAVDGKIGPDTVALAMKVANALRLPLTGDVSTPELLAAGVDDYESALYSATGHVANRSGVPCPISSSAASQPAAALRPPTPVVVPPARDESWAGFGTYLAIGLGALALGGAGVLLYRRRRGKRR